MYLKIWTVHLVVKWGICVSLQVVTDRQTPRKDDSFVSKAMEYMFGWWHYTIHHRIPATSEDRRESMNGLMKWFTKLHVCMCMTYICWGEGCAFFLFYNYLSFNIFPLIKFFPDLNLMKPESILRWSSIKLHIGTVEFMKCSYSPRFVWLSKVNGQTFKSY